MKSTTIQGFKVEVEGTDCFVSKGSFCSSLAAVHQTGTLDNGNYTDTIDVSEDVQRKATEFAQANGW